MYVPIRVLILFLLKKDFINRLAHLFPLSGLHVAHEEDVQQGRRRAPIIIKGAHFYPIHLDDGRTERVHRREGHDILFVAISDGHATRHPSKGFKLDTRMIKQTPELRGGEAPVKKVADILNFLAAFLVFGVKRGIVLKDL